MQAHVYACILEHTACILEHTACTLEYSACILEHSACILEHSGCILKHSETFCLHSGTICMHSATFWNILHHSCTVLYCLVLSCTLGLVGLRLRSQKCFNKMFWKWENVLSPLTIYNSYSILLFVTKLDLIYSFL